MINLTKQAQLQVPVKSKTSSTRPWTTELFEEITDLMAEALFQDFQAHRKATVQSLQGRKHIYSLTEPENELK
jgi:hypothetical protein